MKAPAITRRQREVLNYLSVRGAFSRAEARPVYGTDETVADTLARRGAINKRYDRARGAVYWIRGEGETATSDSVLAGFVVILNRDIMTPKGRKENLFLGRAPYDGKDKTFRHLLRGWMRKLDLRSKDLLSYANFETIGADDPVFGGDHVILDA